MSEVPLYPLQQYGVVQVTGYGRLAWERRHKATRRERESKIHGTRPVR